jgi:hypothetical protein
MADITTTIWVWRVQADKAPEEADPRFTRFRRQQTFIDGVPVGAPVELDPDTVALSALATPADLFTP